MSYGSTKTAEQLAREDVERQTLEAAAQRIEQENGNEIYRLAWKKAVRIIREMKPN